MPDARCPTCGKPLPKRTAGRGRASEYCSSACRQRAYRSRKVAPVGAGVEDLIGDIERRVHGLTPHPPATFFEDVTALSSSVGRLRRVARIASDAAQVTETESEAEAESDPGDLGDADVADVAALAAVRAGDEWEFAALVEPHRRELQVHCYRMVGSYDDSEDLVQETFLRAWRRRDGFQGRATFRAWLYRIATNACLDFLRRNTRRPSRYEPVPGFDSGPGEPPARLNWMQPYPDELMAEVASTEAEPGDEAASRETMELVFLAAIQHLPPRQRAVLILRDALGSPATETAELLEMSVASVNSALQRARPALRKHLPERRADWTRSTQSTVEERAILQRYMAAAEHADVSVMAEMLSEDAVLTMPPNPIWFTGRDAILAFISPVFDVASPQYFGRWRHLPTRANGQPAAGGYVQRPGTTVYRAQVLDVLRIEDGKIAEITSFEPHLFPAFGLPLTL